MIVEEYKKEKERLKKWRDYRDSSDLPNLKEKHKKIVDRIGEYLQIPEKVVVKFGSIEGAEGDLHLIFEDGGIETHGWKNKLDYILKKLKNHGKKIGEKISGISAYPEENDKIERKFKKVKDMLKDYESPPNYEYEMEITNLPRYIKTDKELFTNGKPIFRKSVTLRVYGSSTGITFGFFDNNKEVGKDSVGVAYKNDNSILRLSQVNVEGLVKKFKKDWKRIEGKCDKILDEIGGLDEM